MRRLDSILHVSAKQNDSPTLGIKHPPPRSSSLWSHTAVGVADTAQRPPNGCSAAAQRPSRRGKVRPPALRGSQRGPQCSPSVRAAADHAAPGGDPPASRLRRRLPSPGLGPAQGKAGTHRRERARRLPQALRPGEGRARRAGSAGGWGLGRVRAWAGALCSAGAWWGTGSGGPQPGEAAGGRVARLVGLGRSSLTGLCASVGTARPKPCDTLFGRRSPAAVPCVPEWQKTSRHLFSCRNSVLDGPRVQGCYSSEILWGFRDHKPKRGCETCHPKVDA